MIKVLDKSVASKIAAGEVIEGPVSIVKELVENSIDSGATSITIEIKKGGKEYIRVSDNGCGIPTEEVETAFLRHATSKLREAKDLDFISTLGFRGEALASICAISKTSMVTKTQDEKLGTKILIKGGETIEKSSTGAPVGTTIIIEGLFFNVPARSKFLKSDSAESSKIIDLVSRIAISHVDTSFRLISGGSTIFASSGRRRLLSTIVEVYKQREYMNLLYFEHERDGIKAYGYISRTELSRPTRRNQYAFVNGRVVKSKAVDRGIEEGYAERLFEGRHPVAFVFVSTPPEFLDVNIHPNKKEVRFSNDSLVTEVIEEGIFACLAKEDAINHALKNRDRSYSTYRSNGDGEKNDDNNTNVNSLQAPLKDSIDSLSPRLDVKVTSRSEEKRGVALPAEDLQPLMPESHLGSFQNGKIVDSSEQIDIKSLLKTMRVAEEEHTFELEEIDSLEEENTRIDIETPRNKPFNIEELDFNTTIFGTYILCTSHDTLYIIDQHAAHERVFYEKLVGEYNCSKKESQLILTPFTLDFSMELVPLIESLILDMGRLGYGVQLFGTNTLIFREIPNFMSLSEAEEFARTYIEKYPEYGASKNTVVIDKLITMSCKSAIKAHDYIKAEEVRSLLDQLKVCKNPFSCPHGRPTFIKMTKGNIEHLFKRK